MEKYGNITTSLFLPCMVTKYQKLKKTRQRKFKGNNLSFFQNIFQEFFRIWTFINVHFYFIQPFIDFFVEKHGFFKFCIIMY
jgi:hypothetical protein